MRIFLTGFMGSGKSHTGSRLARELLVPFVDLDQWIEEQQATTVRELFERDGEAAFRQLETSSLRGFGAVPQFVMATGGGLATHSGNMEWMLQHGMVVFLDVSEQLLCERLTNERDQRPLLHGNRDLQQLINEKMKARRPDYEKAHIHLEVTDPKTDVVRLLVSHMTEITDH